MINANTVRELAESHLARTTGFLVDVRVSDGNAISILLDDDEGTSIEKCMALSRHLESMLDRDDEDFSLDEFTWLGPAAEVAPAIPEKHRARRAIEDHGSREAEGKLTATEEEITIVVREKRRIGGRKAKEWVEEEQTYPLSALDWTKVQISFKGN